jgi:hypothetical protein
LLRRLLLALALGAALPATAQDWGDLDTLIMGQLTGGATLESSTFMPDAADPAAASRAIAVAYTHIPGSAGSVDIHVGLFRKETNAWRLMRKIDGLYGMGVENPVFSGQTFEVTTNMLGPDDPRCCPTLKVRWRIDLDTADVTRLN